MRNGTASGTRTQLLRLERPATQPICLWQHMEMRAGFEPANNRVAACPLEPLGHLIEFGTPDRTRTCGRRIRSPVLYPTELLGRMVRAAGIEPARIAPPGFKPGASASSTTPAASQTPEDSLHPDSGSAGYYGVIQMGQQSLCLVDKKDAPRNACGTTLLRIFGTNSLSTAQVGHQARF